MVADEVALEPARPHIPVWVALGALGGELVEDQLAESQHPLIEGAPPDPGPGGESIGAADTRVQDEAGVLQQPWHQSVSNGDVFANAGLKTQLERAEQPADATNADLGTSVALGLVLGRVLLGDVGDALDARLNEVDDLVHHGLERRPVVRFDDHLRVTKPCHVAGYELRGVRLLVGPFAGDTMCEHILRGPAADNHALDDLSVAPRLFSLRRALYGVVVAELVLLLHPLVGDVEIIYADLRDL